MLVTLLQSTTRARESLKARARVGSGDAHSCRVRAGLGLDLRITRYAVQLNQ